MIVVRKVLATILWWVVFFAVILSVMVAFVLTQLDLTGDQETVDAAAAAMGQDLGAQYGLLVFFGTLGLAALGSIYGILPFSRHHKREAE